MAGEQPLHPLHDVHVDAGFLADEEHLALGGGDGAEMLVFDLAPSML
ncbi:MAG: hypothetical protein JNN21_14330 [Candidatus Accumulibacter sp.]|nr:hypothetical protein [Accumulibacter sp.]